MRISSLKDSPYYKEWAVMVGPVYINGIRDCYVTTVDTNELWCEKPCISEDGVILLDDEGGLVVVKIAVESIEVKIEDEDLLNYILQTETQDVVKYFKGGT